MEDIQPPPKKDIIPEELRDPNVRRRIQRGMVLHSGLLRMQVPSFDYYMKVLLPDIIREHPYVRVQSIREFGLVRECYIEPDVNFSKPNYHEPLSATTEVTPAYCVEHHINYEVDVLLTLHMRTIKQLPGEFNETGLPKFEDLIKYQICSKIYWLHTPVPTSRTALPLDRVHLDIMYRQHAHAQPRLSAESLARKG